MIDSQQKETFAWWYIDSSTGAPAYTQARNVSEAKNNFGGRCNPIRVTDEIALQALRNRTV